MSRQFFLALANLGHRVPIGIDLVLRQHADAEALLHDGTRLGQVVEETARLFRSPLGFLPMDLTLEKAGILRRFGVGEGEAADFHFTTAPSPAERAEFTRKLTGFVPTLRLAANLGALQHVATQTKLLPVGMAIGPFSLTTKLLADPITPVFLAGTGATATEEPDVALLEACLELSLAYVLRYVEVQIAAGARAIFIAEPAANQVYLSPRQLETGSDILERFVLAPNRRVAEVLATHGVDHLFHCCGEIVDPILDGFCSLHPVLLSLGSSRRLWEDAARVPRDVVLYGNLPSKQFYSDQLMPADRVTALATDLLARMQATGHPFILGTECDTLHVDGCGDTLLRKVQLLLDAPAPSASAPPPLPDKVTQ
ncbi:MAG: hypothetical protein HZC55_05565 [Verrucomicrobia bacterium]|nr:hypothetical protein [Verrucomicrobiota bacterium]